MKPKPSLFNSIADKITRATKEGKKGEIMRVKTETERRYVLLIAVARNLPIVTRKDGKEYSVIAA